MTDTKIVVSYFTNDYYILKRHWQSKRQGTLLTTPEAIRYNSQFGSIVIFDLQSKIEEHMIDEKCPFGIKVLNKNLLVCDANENILYIYSLPDLHLVRRVFSNYFNDMHSISSAHEDSLIITSSGIDTVLISDITLRKFTPLVTLKIKNEKTIVPSKLSNNINYSKNKIPTSHQATHLNFASFVSRDKLLISLFHQNEIIEYDISTGITKPVITGLNRPHSFFVYKNRLYLADSDGKSIKVYELFSYALEDTIVLNGWIQEIKLQRVVIDNIKTSVMSVVDADNSIIYLYKMSDLTIITQLNLDKNKRIASCELFEI